MSRRAKLLALGGAAIGLGAGLAAQHSVVTRRRRNDTESAEPFGKRRGVRSRMVDRPDGASLFVEEAGPESKTGAVFLHGSALRTDLWHYQLEGIDAHRLLFVDLRGHGRSQPKGDAEFSIVTLAEDLAAVIEEAGLDEVVVVGHSVGGAVAMELCRLRPEWTGSRLKGVVLVSTSYRPLAETTAAGAALARVERFARRPLEIVRQRSAYLDSLRRIVRPSDTVFLAVSMTGFGPHASAKQVDFVYDMLADTKSDVILDLIKSYRDFDMRDSFAAVSVPALVVSGTDDRITVHGASEVMVEQLPKAELRVFERCGHMPMMERHREFNTMLAAFLDDQLGRDRPARRRNKS